MSLISGVKSVGPAAIHILFLTNNNHLSNVRTLQSIYNQEYPNIHLSVCDDCSDRFQSERFFYNLGNMRPEQVRSIYFHENEYPIGECCTLANLLSKFTSDYVFILHSGEYFTSASALSQAVRTLEDKPESDGVICSSEQWSDDMKKRLSNISAPNIDNQTIFQYQADRLRNCMVLYRESALRRILPLLNPQGHARIAQQAVAALLEDGAHLIVGSFPLCKFSENSIQGLDVEIPPTFEDVRISEISKRFKSEKQEMSGASEAVVMKIAKRNRNRINRLTRSKSIKGALFIDALLVLCICMLFVLDLHPPFILPVLCVVAVLVTGWVGAALCIYYYKKSTGM